jgi:hypothetical protein
MNLFQKVTERFRGVPVALTEHPEGVGIQTTEKGKPRASGVIQNEKQLEIFHRVITAKGEE